MKRTSRTLIVAAAVSGLLSGAAVQQTCGQTAATNIVAGKVAPLKKAPKIHDCAGQNDCKGIGGCKTDSHGCKFTNACKAKGGCEITAKDIKAWEKKQKEAAAKAAAAGNPPAQSAPATK